MILLIHPTTGDAVSLKSKADAGLFRLLVLDGYQPVGPRCQALAAVIRTEAGASKAAA